MMILLSRKLDLTGNPQSIPMVVKLWVLADYKLNVLYVVDCRRKPTNWTPLLIAQFVLNNATELVFIDMSLHEPLPVETDQVEPMVALIDPDQVWPLQELS